MVGPRKNFAFRELGAGGSKKYQCKQAALDLPLAACLQDSFAMRIKVDCFTVPPARFI